MSETHTTITAPVHQRPTSCHICGSADDHGPTFEQTGKGHNFWSNADAMNEAREHDRRTTVRYSSGATTPEAAYVEAHIPEAAHR